MIVIAVRAHCIRRDPVTRPTAGMSPACRGGSCRGTCVSAWPRPAASSLLPADKDVGSCVFFSKDRVWTTGRARRGGRTPSLAHRRLPRPLRTRPLPRDPTCSPVRPGEGGGRVTVPVWASRPARGPSLAGSPPGERAAQPFLAAAPDPVGGRQLPCHPAAWPSNPGRAGRSPRPRQAVRSIRPRHHTKGCLSAAPASSWLKDIFVIFDQLMSRKRK